MTHEPITTERQLESFCRKLAGEAAIAFDTEFVSEHTYRPQLCLVQVAAGGQLTAIDPLAVGDLTRFWEALAAPGHETIVHAGREELAFCLAAVGRPPGQLFDVQIAAGMIGLDYPAGYGTLIGKLLGETPEKGETRTDWRRRPLSARQLEYALADVRHLPPLWEVLRRRLAELGRLGWFESEMAAWQAGVQSSQSRERWRKVAGSSSLSRRSQAIVRELWLWREVQAERRNSPVRRVLRDDLIVELAKRRSADPKQIRAVRGMERRDFEQVLPALGESIAKALALADAHCPPAIRREASPQLSMLSQFLSTALTCICRAAEVAPSLVSTVGDVRELVAYRLGESTDQAETVPRLAWGWRAEVVGQVLDDLLTGKVSIRIQDPHCEQPLAFEPVRRISS